MYSHHHQHSAPQGCRRSPSPLEGPGAAPRLHDQRPPQGQNLTNSQLRWCLSFKKKGFCKFMSLRYRYIIHHMCAYWKGHLIHIPLMKNPCIILMSYFSFEASLLIMPYCCSTLCTGIIIIDQHSDSGDLSSWPSCIKVASLCPQTATASLVTSPSNMDL